MSAVATTKERPILMHARSVNSILAGRKTQTRRIVKPPPREILGAIELDDTRFRWDKSRTTVAGTRVAQQVHASNINDFRAWLILRCPYGQPGDRLWVRETFYIDTVPTGPLTFVVPEDVDRDDVYYRADGDCCKQIPECSCAEVGKPKWRSSIHMPRWASRLVLEITDVRVERVQDISKKDIEAEGLMHGALGWYGGDGTADAPGRCFNVPQNAFGHLWNQTNGAGAWDRNDWVWVVGFRSAK